MVAYVKHALLTVLKTSFFYVMFQILKTKMCTSRVCFVKLYVHIVVFYHLLYFFWIKKKMLIVLGFWIFFCTVVCKLKLWGKLHILYNQYCLTKKIFFVISAIFNLYQFPWMFLLSWSTELNVNWGAIS